MEQTTDSIDSGNNSVSNSKIAASAVDSNAGEDGSLTDGDFADGAVLEEILSNVIFVRLLRRKFAMMI